VPEPAVRQQLADLERSLCPGVLEREGFAAVHLIRTPEEQDALAIDRA
jgi:hypothetical protein